MSVYATYQSTHGMLHEAIDTKCNEELCRILWIASYMWFTPHQMNVDISYHEFPTGTVLKLWGNLSKMHKYLAYTSFQ